MDNDEEESQLWLDLHEHSDASMSAIKQSSKDYLGACHQIRYFGLTSSATDKLASFLLESAVFGQNTPEGIRFNLRLKQERLSAYPARRLTLHKQNSPGWIQTGKFHPLEI